MELNEITAEIINSAYKVANRLGTGFMEKVYENALAYELRKCGLRVAQQSAVRILYDGTNIGDYYADLLVEGSVTVELKAVRALDEIHMAQCLNYLKATGLKICLLINFGTPKVQIKRLVHNL